MTIRDPKRLPILLIALLLAGCAGNQAPAYPEPTDEPGRRAAAILRECRDPAADRMTCHERSLLEILEADGVATAMATLERMGEMEESVKSDGHVYAHAIGLAAYTTAAEAGVVFDRCTPSFQSGCYHGVIQSYFVDEASRAGPDGVSAEAINALCARSRADAESKWKLFQCAHGIGHGVTQMHGHDLRMALGACDLVADWWERQACYGGAFMENVVQATIPHHTVGRPQSGAEAEDHGEHHGGHHGGAAAEPAFKPLDPADPLYPCNVLEERYLVSCYQMQTSPILFYNQGDVGAAARACDGAPEAYRAICYQSLGRDVSARTVQKHDEAQRLCALGDPRYRVECYAGYVKNLVDLTARPDDGFAFCRLIPDAGDKPRCYTAIGEEIAVLATHDPTRASLCSTAEPEYVAACRAGAGVAENFEL